MSDEWEYDSDEGRRSAPRSRDKVGKAITEEGVDLVPLDLGSIVIDEVTFRVLPLPPASACPDHENSNSIVVRFEFGEFSMLFTGDAEHDEQEFLMANTG